MGYQRITQIKKSVKSFNPCQSVIQTVGGMMKLVEIAQLNMGQSPPSSSYNDNGEGLPFYQGKTDFGFINPLPRKYCNEPKKIANKGDILISVRAPVGPVNIANEKCCIGRGLAAIKAISYNQLFLYFNLIYQERHIESFGTGSTFKAINKSQLEEIIIPDTSLPEQRKIAYILSTVQRAIEQQDKLIRTITELKKALMQKLFTEGTKGEKQKQTEIGLVPESWEIQPFENTGEVIYGIQAAVANNTKPEGHKILTNKNITLEGKIDLEKINYFELSSKRHFQTILKKGDLLFNWRSGSKEHVGKTALFDLEDGEYTHSSFILRIRVNEKHNNLFLYYYLNFLREIGYYQKVQTFSINAKFNKSAINAMLIALPKRDEQDNISKIINIIDRKIDYHQKKKNTLTALFKTLLHELMTGAAAGE